MKVCAVAGVAALALGCTGSVSPQDTPANAGGTANIGGTGGSPSVGGGMPSPVCQEGAVVPAFHRLNRIQYENSVNAALGTTLALRDDLPVDSLVHGFDNNADVAMSATLMQKYLNSAKSAVDTALADEGVKATLIPCALGSDPNCARTVLQAFLPKAFRRPVTAPEVEDHLKYMTLCSSSPEAGIGCALQAAFLSPKFLFRTELLGTPQAAMCSESVNLTSSSQGMLGDYALAARLSYFLWNGPPDGELNAAAQSGALQDPAALAAQVERMLDPALDDHTRMPFVEDFPTQWLQLVGVENAAPSSTLFPDFDDELRQALKDESLSYFAEVLLRNRSALDLVRAEFTFMNERLAEHYGFDTVTGPVMQLVDTAGSARGGILTQGSFLTTTSSSENTSIVLRAKWVLNNLLCEHLPSPPAGAAEEVPAPDPGLGLTNRESLEIRTSGVRCNSCHAILNPIGFGLEIFDAVGAERELDRGKPIDASGVLPGGATFSDTAGLLALLKSDERFPVCLTQKMLTYALGRGMTAACDSGEIQSLAADFKADGFVLKNHVIRIVQSDLFRTARALVNVPPAAESPVEGESPEEGAP